MRKLSFFVSDKVLLLLVLLPLSSNAFGPWALITNGKEILETAINAFNTLEQLHKDAVATSVEKITPAQGAILRKVDSIYWDLKDLKTDISNWQKKQEKNKIAEKIDELLTIVSTIEGKYEDYERFRFNNSFVVNGMIVKAEQDRIKSFAKSAISYDNGELSHSIKHMHKLYTGIGALGDSILSTIAHNEEANLMCVRQQSAQQLIAELYRIVIDADMKGLIVKLFAFDELEKNKVPHHYDYSRTTEKEQFEARVDKTTDKVKSMLSSTSREVWRCDPPVHKKDVTYTKIQEVFQTYAYYEKDYRDSCSKKCPDFSSKYDQVTDPKCVTSFCKKHTERKRCHGTLRNCQKIHQTQKYCFAPETSDRRYEWMLTGSQTAYGTYDPRCMDTVDVSQEQGHVWVHGRDYKSDCDTCLCTCVSNEQGIVRHFSLNPVYSDTHKNMAVTGIRFVKNGNIISLQIQQGRLGENGSIDQSSLNWVNETERNYGVYTISEEKNTVFLDDIVYPENMHVSEHVVYGVQLQEWQNSLRLAVLFVPFDFPSGKMNDILPMKSSFTSHWPKDKRLKLNLDESRDPTRKNGNLLDSTTKQYVEFQVSGLEQDLGQSTIPFIDIQEVVSKPAVPLAGIGLIHKGSEGYGGFLGLKLIDYDYTPFL